jgi:outer membrane protein OmpA-like peptidoglycan-associated protein
MSATRSQYLYLAAALVFAACATPPRPPELDAFEKLKMNPNYEAARVRAPELVNASDKLFNKSREEWSSNDLEESRRDALMGSIKLKTALALVEQDQSRARVQRANGELARSEDEYVRVAKDLQATSEQISLMQKLADTRSKAEADKVRMAQQLNDEQQRASARDKISAAELALRTADTVEAKSYAQTEYSAASDGLERAQTELKAGNYAAASTSADLARTKAEAAVAKARPSFEQTEQSKTNKARDEALARDAAGLSGVTVRLERRGDVQRLILPLHELFVTRKTVLAPGNEAKLDAVAALLKKYPTYSVQIVGHTDKRGKHDELVALSLARAQSVYSAMAMRGVETKRMMATGQGPDEPLSDNRTASGRAQNNRVEIIFVY